MPGTCGSLGRDPIHFHCASGLAPAALTQIGLLYLMLAWLKWPQPVCFCTWLTIQYIAFAGKPGSRKPTTAAAPPGIDVLPPAQRLAFAICLTSHCLTPAPESRGHRRSDPTLQLLKDSLLRVACFIKAKTQNNLPAPAILLSCDPTQQDFCTTTEQRGWRIIPPLCPQPHCSIFAELGGVQDCAEQGPRARDSEFQPVRRGELASLPFDKCCRRDMVHLPDVQIYKA